jgi:hypothetical protein
MKIAPIPLNKTSLHQQGAVLFIGLILLLGVTLLSISGMQSVVLNQRMATNAFEVERDDQLAESAGKYAIQQNAWVNSALNGLEATLNGEPTANYTISDLVAGENSEPATVGLWRRSFQDLGVSVGSASGISTVLIETYGNAGVENGGSTIVQGFKYVIPGDGNE